MTVDGSAAAGLASRLEALEAQVARLDERLGRADDELAVLRLIASYAPAVDSGRADAVAALWTADGVYDVDTGVLDGRKAIAAMVEGDAHQGLIAHGCGHVPGLPVVRLDGDRAVATGHTQLLVRSHDGGRFVPLRVTANRWELERTGSASGPDRGWAVVRRTARVLGPDGAGRDLLSRADD